jgi:uncharacterized protein (DUF58 family)
MRTNLRERLFSRSRAAEEEDPFDARLFTSIDRMRLRIQRASGARSGETLVRGLTQESGIEVEGFKTYTPGDDIRYVDWNAAARIDQLLTRRFVAEREIPVHLLLDASASMAAPSGDAKFFFARKLVAALAYIALNNNDPVRVTALGSDKSGGALSSSPMLRHRGRYLRLKPMLEALRADGPTMLLEGVSKYLEQHRERGVAVLLSDFLVPSSEYEEALSRLASRKLEVQAIQVIGRGDQDLSGAHGRLRIRDVETGKVREVVLDGSQRRRYEDALARRTEAIRSFCHARGIAHAVAYAQDGIEHCMTKILSRSGMLKLR